MNPDILDVIKATTAGSLNGTLSFPEVVRRLLEVGVERYHVDLSRLEKTTYLRTGESVAEAEPMHNEPIADAFVADDVAAAVRASQTQGQPYREFLVRARRAGCVGYVAFLDGRCVVYGGRRGEQHVERWPG